MLSKQTLTIIFCFLCSWQVKTSGADNDLQKNTSTAGTTSTGEACEDFYSYACNKDKQLATLNYNNEDSQADYQFNLAILNLMEKFKNHEIAMNHKCSEFMGKAVMYYNSCLEADKKNPRKFLEEIKPGQQLNWPLLEKLGAADSLNGQWPYGKEFDFWTFLGKLNSYGFNNVLVRQDVGVDAQGNIFINLRPFLINNNTLPQAKYWEGLITFMKLEKTAKIISDFKKTYEKLAEISKKFRQGYGKVFELNYEDLRAVYPNLPLNLFLNEVTEQQLPADTLIFITNPDYFDYLNKNFATDFEQIELVNYIMFKFLDYSNLKTQNKNVAVECAAALRYKFNLAVNFIYRDQIFSAQEKLIKPQLEEVLKVGIDLLANHISKNALNLTTSQLQKVLEELSAVHLNIGNLPEATDCEKVEKFYAQLRALDEKNFYKNHLLMLKYNFEKSSLYKETFSDLLMFRRGMDHTLEINYLGAINKIVLPFASLPAFVNRENSNKNNPLFAFLIARQLTENFIGKVVTYYPPIQNTDYENIFSCWRNQVPEDVFTAYTNTMAIEVLRKYVNLQKANNTMEFPNQNFFLDLSHFFCFRNYEKYQLNPIVMNMEEFSNVFNCSKGTKMNPAQKCKAF